MDWILGQLGPHVMGIDGDENHVTAVSKKNKSVSNSANTGSSSGSTPVASIMKVDTSAFMALCFKDDCARDCASDVAASLHAGESQWNDEEGGTPQHYRTNPRRKRNGQEGSKQSKSKSTKATKPKPPQVISVYRPSRSWPDGTLQIIWRKKAQNVFGIKGIDLFEAHLELTLDDLSTIEISSEITSKYSSGTVEIHPDETTIQRIGHITCFVIRPMSLKLPSEKHKECPPLLDALLSQIQSNTMFQNWRREEVPNESMEDFEDSIHDLHWRHHWHPTASIMSYLWIEDVTVDSRYRGTGFGLCLIEDACKRVAEGLSWILAAPRHNTSLESYFRLMGFASLENPQDEKSISADASPFLARWNASPFNPNLDEVLPCVPNTAQQSREQGFQL